MATKIQFKRGVKANLNAVTLSAGEPAFVTDEGKLYIGDGTTKILINPIDKPAGLDTVNLYTKVKVNDYGQVTQQANIAESDFPPISYTKITGLGSSATKDTGTASGNIPILDSGGKLNSSVIPISAIRKTFVVNTEAAMLNSAADVGDVAVRTDLSKTFILQTAPPNNINNWVEMLTPTSTVSSVNSMTGSVVLDGSNIYMTGYAKASSYTAITATDLTNDAIGKLEKNFENFAKPESPSFTGSPTAPTPSPGDNTTKLATTEFVNSSIASAPIDGGNF